MKIFVLIKLSLYCMYETYNQKRHGIYLANNIFNPKF